VINTFFPRPHPDELLYSVMARFARTSGITERLGSVSKLIYDVQGLMPVVMLPRRLEHVASLIPSELKIDGETLLNRHTLYNYLFSFETEERRIQARDQMMDPLPGAKPVPIGQMMPPVTWLRYCPRCNAASMQNPLIQEMYWHRKHQLPGIDVCPVHGIALRLSEVRIGAGGGVHYRAATPKLCPETSSKLACPDNPELMAELTEIGSRGLAYLDHLAVGHDRSERVAYIRGCLETAGLMDRNKFARTSAMARLQERWPETFRYHSHLAKPVAWFGDILTGGKTRNSVLAHVMVDIWLSELSSAVAVLPRSGTRSAQNLRSLRSGLMRQSPDQHASADKELKLQIQIAANAIRGERPYRRVTKAALARATGISWLIKRRYRQKMPLVALAVEGELESSDAYLRRIATLEWEVMVAEGAPLFLHILSARLRIARTAAVTIVLKEVVSKYFQSSDHT
jgi:hypothetical protein